MSIPVFINCFNRLRALSAMVEWFERARGVGDIVFVDNGSTYGPLLDYLNESPHRSVFLGHNVFGPRGVWRSGVIGLYRPEFFIVTDDDVVPREDCPRDALLHFRDILQKDPRLRAVGFSLEIDDIPDCYSLKGAVLGTEPEHWKEPYTIGVLKPDSGRTFPATIGWRAGIAGCNAPLYRGGTETVMPVVLENDAVPLWLASDSRAARLIGGSTVRTARPYTARHMSWYMDSDNPGPDDLHYLEKLNPGSGITWSATTRAMRKGQ